ncbi:hypothetical protein N7474_005045 [Penicillium riverlandense]|uniref:uncharacterized protein n=1 Tax=Penicillium riverlandense TaxID=1903569 RepID=UPI002546EA58|nr:uncharacterized protein N7474_005045 [Penicillium riverlandense]KAJ5819454.1 hypothetical protein N7474_005045 [Penicillium riverlandense]
MTSTSVTFPGVNNGFQVGINNGPIHLPPERLEPRPEPLSTVPFPRDPDFVSRDAIGQIHEKASIPGSRIALVGLGGVRKSQLAIEYAHQVRRQSAETWVFWIHASNTARCEKSLRDLADRVKISGRQDRTANIFQLIGNWLQDEKIGNWILVLDNVDDDGFLRKPSATTQEGQANSQTNASTQPPPRYLLKSSNGYIIITSRNRRVALDIADQKNIIAVQRMKKAEALDLLQQKLHTPTELEDMEQLVEALEFMPLAIVQAASYITHRSPRCSVSQYLEKIRNSDREAVRLLDREAGLLYRDWEAKNSILLTWQISFDHIQGVRPSAAGLLSLMSFFDRQGIQESVLQVPKIQEMNRNLCLEKDEDSSGGEDGDNASGSDTDQCFEDDITTLSDYSLISVGERSAVLTMHRLVQLTVRTWLKTHGQLELWKERFISNLCQKFPTGEFENWEQCRSLFPHLKSAMLQRPDSQESLLQWATLLFKGAWYAQESGNITDAREMASKSRKQRVRLLGVTDGEALDSTAMLATAYRLGGLWEEAEKLEVQVMETRKMKLGQDHPDTLTSIANLASTYSSRAETRKTRLGEDDHPDTLSSIANLAATFWNQARWEEAEQLFVQVVETHKTKLGEDHPDTLSSMANLASTFSHQGRWEEAERLEVQVMETSKRKLGEDHPDTLSSIANLAATYREQGQWEKAKKLRVQAVDARKRKLGEDHPDTLSSMANLAFPWKSLGRNADAGELLRECLAKQKQTLGA